MKKKISLALLFVLIFSTLFTVTVFAASWPSLSSSGYCEFTVTKQINVYKDTALKTRGTSSPSKEYNAYISKNDVCYIYKITSSYMQVNYPTSTGRRTGYIKRSDLISESSPTKSVTSKGKETTYVSDGGKTYGNIDKNDTVYVCGTNGAYTAVMYTAKSGKRAYKFGWIKTSDYNSSVIGESEKPKSNKNTSNSSLADIARGEIGYQGTNKNGKGAGDYTKYGKDMGWDGVQWCATFVSWCAKEAGISTSVIYHTPDCDTMESKSNSYHKWDKNTMKSLKKDDVIFFAKTSKLSDSDHVGIVTSVNTSKKTITVVEGNTGQTYGPDIVKEITYTVNSTNGKITKGYKSGYSFCGYISVN